MRLLTGQELTDAEKRIEEKQVPLWVKLLSKMLICKIQKGEALALVVELEFADGKDFRTVYQNLIEEMILNPEYGAINGKIMETTMLEIAGILTIYEKPQPEEIYAAGMFKIMQEYYKAMDNTFPQENLQWIKDTLVKELRGKGYGNGHKAK